MTKLTLEPGVLRVASAFPDPPFEVADDGGQTGFDRELMRLICDHLGLPLRPVPYGGNDFEGIFDGLGDGSYDAVISGTTITPERERMALFSTPYLQFDQGLAVNVRRNPEVRSSDDLSTGRVGALIKLFPVLLWLVKGREGLAVIDHLPTQEKIGIAFARTNTGLCRAVNESLETLKKSGGFESLRSKWFDEPQGD